MARRSRGFRSKTRYKMQKRPRDRGMPPVSHALRTFEEGATVAIVLNPAVHKGQPHPRFHGWTGTVQARRGDAYEVKIKVGGKRKLLIARPEHLTLIASQAKAE